MNEEASRSSSYHKQASTQAPIIVAHLPPSAQSQNKTTSPLSFTSAVPIQYDMPLKTASRYPTSVSNTVESPRLIETSTVNGVQNVQMKRPFLTGPTGKEEAFTRRPNRGKEEASSTRESEIEEKGKEGEEEEEDEEEHDEEYYMSDVYMKELEKLSNKQALTLIQTLLGLDTSETRIVLAAVLGVIDLWDNTDDLIREYREENGTEPPKYGTLSTDKIRK